MGRYINMDPYPTGLLISWTSLRIWLDRRLSGWGTRRARVDWRKESEVKEFSCRGSLRTKSPTYVEGETWSVFNAGNCWNFVCCKKRCSHWNTQQVTLAWAKFISGSDAGKSLEEDGSEDWLLLLLLATYRERYFASQYLIYLYSWQSVNYMYTFHLFHSFILFSPPASASASSFWFFIPWIVQSVAPEGSFPPNGMFFIDVWNWTCCIFNDEKDLHRAAPRDVTLENISWWWLVVTSI